MEREATENEMVGLHHRLDGHEFEQAPRDSEAQGSLACFLAMGCEASAMTVQLNINRVHIWSPKSLNVKFNHFIFE